MPDESATAFVECDVLRTRFAGAMSAMYRAEVPLYGDLINIVQQVNETSIQHAAPSGKQEDKPGILPSSERLTLERHGAIRLGTPFELQTIKRVFALLGMHPLGYYDLSIAGLPMHATCFRPTSVSSLARNPFRVFTTLLRPELLASEKARQLALGLLDRRKIFSDKLMEGLSIAEGQDGRLTEDQAEIFIPEALSTFSWQSVAAATFDEYQILKAEHPILADIASFQNAHINHLTPRTLNISAVQFSMKAAGMAVKSHIEGPPHRKCPILLRQTSFLALEETVQFKKSQSDRKDIHEVESADGLIMASHKARFGEIEQRGAAVTPSGRALYDDLLNESKLKAAGVGPDEAEAITLEVFKQYPDTWSELRRHGLIYCQFRTVNQKVEISDSDSTGVSLLETLIENAAVEASPITYEDFLPFSAAGIFQSNLQSAGKPGRSSDLEPAEPDSQGLEKALGDKILDLDEWYARAQRQSLEIVATELGFSLEQLTQS